MFSANAYVIRRATASEAWALRRGGWSLTAPALIGEIDGRPAAAISVADGRIVADPFGRGAQLTPLLHMRARAQRALERTPSLAQRLRDGVRVRRPAAAPA